MCQICWFKRNKYSLRFHYWPLADHKTQNSTIQLNSERHQEALRMEITLRSKFGLWNQMNINWQICFQKFFWVASCLIKQGWAHSHNFENLVQLVSESGGKETQMHLLTSPKNATYLSPAYLAKYTSIMNEYTEVLLLKSLIKGHF